MNSAKYVGFLALATAGHFIGMRDGKLPIHWNFKLEPDNFAPARIAAAIPVLFAGVMTLTKRPPATQAVSQAIAAVWLAALARYEG